MNRLGRQEGRAGLMLVPLLAGAWVLGAVIIPRSWLGGHHRIGVEMSGVAYYPAVITAAVGDTVVWINRDLVPHTATSDSAPAWSTAPVLQGDSGILVPSRKGEWTYTCRFHPTMHGKLIVR